MIELKTIDESELLIHIKQEIVEVIVKIDEEGRTVIQYPGNQPLYLSKEMKCTLVCAKIFKEGRSGGSVFLNTSPA